MTAEELIDKLQTAIDNGTLSSTAEVIILDPEYGTITDIEVYYPPEPSYNLVYFQLV